MLVDIASKGGNLLLNIGPTAEGELPAASLQRLAAIGRWMRVNGEAIHDTQAAPFDQAPAWGRVTRRPGKDGMPERLYLHVFDWPADGVLRLPLRRAAVKASLLAAPGTPVAVDHGDGELRLRLPAAAPDTIASVIALDLADEG
jgi:alpha-L-fucosidase